MSRIPEPLMISSNVSILNISVTHLMSSWMHKIEMIGYWSRSTGLLSNQITKFDKDSKVDMDNN